MTESDEKTIQPGYYWFASTPEYRASSPAYGPFETVDEAIDDAASKGQKFIIVYFSEDQTGELARLKSE